MRSTPSGTSNGIVRYSRCSSALKRRLISASDQAVGVRKVHHTPDSLLSGSGRIFLTTPRYAYSNTARYARLGVPHNPPARRPASTVREVPAHVKQVVLSATAEIQTRVARRVSGNHFQPGHRVVSRAGHLRQPAKTRSNSCISWGQKPYPAGSSPGQPPTAPKATAPPHIAPASDKPP